MSTSFRWPPPQGPWAISFEWAEIDGRLEVVAVTLAAAERDRPVTTSDLRAVPLASLIGTARAQAIESLGVESRKAHHGATTARSKTARGFMTLAAGLIDGQIERIGRGRRRLDRAHFERYPEARERWWRHLHS